MTKSKEAAPPAKQSFGDFLYNRRTGEVLSRTPASWGKIGLFYFLYYSGLAAFFAALLAIFLYGFTDELAPVLTGKHSVLPANPFMGFQPMPDSELTLVQFEMGDENSQTPFINGMEDYLKTGQAPDRPATSLKSVNYLEPDEADYRSEADCEATDPADVTRETKPCAFNVSKLPGFLDACPRQDFGFKSGKPCLAIKLNRIYEFLPEIKDGGKEVIVKCQGEHIADKDNVGTDIEYWPKSADGSGGAIKRHFFPYLGQRGYMTPLVFVKFNSLQTNVLLQIVCEPVNLENESIPDYDKGKAHFEIFVVKN